jgi:hypothetical protein
VHAAIARATDPADSREVTRRAAELFVPPGGAARAVVEQMRELAGHERIS